MKRKIIRFQYKPNSALISLMHSDIMNFTDDRIVGFMDKADVSNLRHCGMFLVCENISGSNNTIIYSNPIGIVAMNTSRAIELYNEISNGKMGYIHSQIVDDCSVIKVEPF